MNILKNLTWEIILYSVVSFVVGILMIIFPGKIVDALGIVIGCGFILLAVKNFLEYRNKEAVLSHYQYKLVSAIVYLMIGIYVIVNMSAILSFVSYIVAVIIVIRGIMKIEDAFTLKRMGRKWVPMLVIALICVALGMLVLSLPMNRRDNGTYVAGDTLIATLGFVFALTGIIDFITTLSVSSKIKKWYSSDEYSEFISSNDAAGGEEVAVEDGKEVK